MLIIKDIYIYPQQLIEIQPVLLQALRLETF